MTGINSVSVRLGGASERPTSTVATVKKVSAKTTKDLEAARLELTPSSLESLEIVVAAAEMDSVYDPTDLSAWAPLLSPKASVSVRVETENGATLNLQPIHTSFLLAGLVGGSERRESDGSRVITAAKENIATSAGPVTLKKSVLINLDDNDTDLIDEDGLLAEEGSGLLAPPPAVPEIRTATDDCGGRKACDNCSCGRAERESGSKPEKKPEQVASSSCGNCAKGDAFRCASCPYLGKPAFKPGEEHLVLNLEDDL